MSLFRSILSLGVIVAALALTPLAVAADPTPAELQALEIRGQGLARQCLDPTLPREAFRALCGTAGAQRQPTRAELQALETRGQALNQLCAGRSVVSAAGYRALCGEGARIVTLAAPAASVPSAFDWSDFSIGAGAMLGLVLLLAGIAAGVHYGRRGSVRPRTAS